MLISLLMSTNSKVATFLHFDTGSCFTICHILNFIWSIFEDELGHTKYNPGELHMYGGHIIIFWWGGVGGRGPLLSLMFTLQPN